jgi:hypothetical protein
MGCITTVAAGLAFAALLSAQTADELVNKNLTAHGGVEKLKAIHSLHCGARPGPAGVHPHGHDRDIGLRRHDRLAYHAVQWP